MHRKRLMIERNSTEILRDVSVRARHGRVRPTGGPDAHYCIQFSAASDGGSYNGGRIFRQDRHLLASPRSRAYRDL
jgi:hypothetical protein